MTREEWCIAGAIWLLLGLLADKICENEARKKGEVYKKHVAIVAYLIGPVIIPIALCWEVFEGLAHLFGRR